MESNIAADWLTDVNRIQQVLGLNLGLGKGYPD
jgi:hypothetical protein